MIITVFRSRLNPDGADGYAVAATRMVELATAMAGFISVKGFTAEDGERCTIVEFDSWENHDAWATHLEHRSAQRQGREVFYSTYDLKVGEVQRHLSFPPVDQGLS